MESQESLCNATLYTKFSTNKTTTWEKPMGGERGLNYSLRFEIYIVY